MPQHDDERPQGGAALRPDEVAAESAAELPDREAMSLITGPGGAGPLPVLGHPIEPMPPHTVADPMPPGGATIDPPHPEPMRVAQDVDGTA